MTSKLCMFSIANDLEYCHWLLEPPNVQPLDMNGFLYEFLKFSNGNIAVKMLENWGEGECYTFG